MRMTDPAIVKAFVHAGDARFTITSEKTGAHFTYRVTKHPLSSTWFVRVLTAPGQYTYAGMLANNDGLATTKKSQMTIKAPSVVAFNWFYRRLMRKNTLQGVEFRHQGRCAKCASHLTVPESIDRGFGPTCWETSNV